MFTQELLIQCSGLNKSHRTGANSKHAPIFVGPPLAEYMYLTMKMLRWEFTNVLWTWNKNKSTDQN